MRILKTNLAILFKCVAILMMTVFTFTSCKKDKDAVQAPTVSVEGNYSGKYGFGNDVPDTDQKYRVKAGGIFQEIGTNSGAVIGEGTWKLNGNKLTASYAMNFAPFNAYSISADFESSTGKLTGTWGSGNDPADGGKIDMTRQ